MTWVRGWSLALLLAPACACLVAACGSGTKGCPAEGAGSDSFITVLAPDGSRVCDADVTVDGRPVTYQPNLPNPQDAGCAYAVHNGSLGDGAHEVIAHKAGYLDAHGTIHVSGSAGASACPPRGPHGENITLDLVPADGGVPDGPAHGGLADASADGS